MAYQIAPALMTLNDLEGHSPVTDLFKCTLSSICAAVTRFQMTVCSRGPSATAGLLVTCNIGAEAVHWLPIKCHDQMQSVPVVSSVHINKVSQTHNILMISSLQLHTPVGGCSRVRRFGSPKVQVRGLG